MSGFDTVRDVWQLGPRKAVGYVPQDGGLMTSLTVRECIELYSRLRTGTSGVLHESNSPLSKELLSKYLDYPVSNLSGGTKKKLALLTANIGLFLLYFTLFLYLLFFLCYNLIFPLYICKFK